MCFYSDKYNPQVAKEDISVCKILSSDLSAPWQDFQYEIDVLTPRVYLGILGNGHNGIYVNEGYHSFVRDINYLSVSFPTSLRFRAIIPKGTIYCKNADSYVSEQLIIKELLDVGETEEMVWKP